MNLSGALEHLYSVFGTIPRPQRVEGCSCCIDPGEVEVLLAKPLRDLMPGDLRSYATSALYTVGTWEDFRYFLPRLLEIASRDGFQYPDPEGLLGRIWYAAEHGHTLSGDEQEAVQTFGMAWWSEVLGQDPRRGGLAIAAETVLAALLNLGLPAEELLAAWQIHPRPEAAWHAALFVKDNIMTLAAGGVWNAYLDRTTAATGALLAWLQSSEVIRWLESAFFADPDGPAAQDLSDALLLLGTPA